MEYPGVILLGIATGNIAQCLSFFDFFNKKNRLYHFRMGCAFDVSV